LIALLVLLGQLGGGGPAEDTVLSAVDRNDLAQLQLLLGSGRSPNETRVRMPGQMQIGPERDADFPIGLACERHSHGALRLLLEYGGDPSRCHAWDDASKQALERADLDQQLRAACLDGATARAVAALKRGAHADTRHFDGRSLLAGAAADGNLELMKALVKAGARATTPELNAAVDAGKDEAGAWLVSQGARATSLHAAAKQGLLLTVRALLDRDTAVEGRDEYNITPLCVAAREGRLAVVNLLLDRRAKPNTPCFEHRTALIEATTTGQREVMKTLLARGAQVNLKDDRNTTPLMLAFATGKEDLVRMLLDAGAAVESPVYGGAPLAQAVSHEWPATATWLLEHGAKADTPDLNGATPLQRAAERGNLELVKLLLERGADPLHRDGALETPYSTARRAKRADIADELRRAIPVSLIESFVREGDAETVRSMLEHGADPKQLVNDQTLLFLAAANNSMETVKVLLAHGADPNQEDPRTKAVPLQWAATAEMTAVLLDAGAKVDAVVNTGETALGRAAMYGRPEQALLLLDHGADVNHRDLGGSTPLMRALNVAMVQLLLDHHADPNIRSQQGFTALMTVKGAAKVLLDAGAEPNVVGEQGWTPLMAATAWRDADAVKALLAAGAKRDAKDKKGQRAVEQARKAQWADGVKLLSP
jgi:ankyrin repeat protein